MLHPWESWLDSLFTKRIKNLLAKALYDNMAECPEELAFQKGDIVTVMEQNVVGSHGWWRCSLHGRQGLAPANRLYLLSSSQAESLTRGAVAHCLNACSERWRACNGTHHGIYQTPRTARQTPSQTYEPMDRIYKVPSTPQVTYGTQGSMMNKSHSVDMEWNFPLSKSTEADSSKSDVYDVPSQLRWTSLCTASQNSSNQLVMRKNLKALSSELEKKCEFVTLNSRSDPSYDVPVPLAFESQRSAGSGCSTLPRPQKSEWIYDVPMTPEKPALEPATFGTMPSGVDRQLSKRLQERTLMEYDVPKPSCFPRPPVSLSPQSTYDVPPVPKRPDGSACGNSPKSTRCPLTGWQPHDRTSPVREPSELELARDKVDKRGGGKNRWGEHSQPSSSISSSSSSSQESLVPRSSPPETLREVTLTPEDAARRLVELQDAVCLAVPRLMVFVSSTWRTRKHMSGHVREIRAAAEDIAGATARFLDFALDVRGNAQHLSDTNLQLRLHRQLSIVEDSGLILQQAVDVLADNGWHPEALAQVPGEVQTLDQLDRFVMVARTMPEDIKRLVSILNANGKLLFRHAQKQPDVPADGNRSMTKSGEMTDSGGEDSDYVQLQTKTEFEKQQRIVQENKESKQTAVQNVVAVAAPAPQRGLSEHCRLYFGALQKAIMVFVESLVNGQPPESFIDQGKLVIMVGQRLVDTLCREAQVQEATVGKELLCKSNHLCALLKQLAVATKKAALHFPDRQALQEVEDFAKELAQRAQYFRTTMDCRD